MITVTAAKERLYEINVAYIFMYYNCIRMVIIGEHLVVVEGIVCV